MDEFRLEVLSAADHLAAVLRLHAQAVVEGAVDDRKSAGNALSDALGRYGVAVVNVQPDEEAAWDAGELTDWLGEDDGLEAAELDDPADEPVLALFHRVDVEVRDAELLRQSAADVLRQCGPFTEEADVQEEVAYELNAVAHLLGSGEPPLVAWLERHGLEVRAEAWQTIALSESMASFPETPWQPLFQPED